MPVVNGTTFRVACHDCGLVSVIPPLSINESARCSRCDHLLTTRFADLESRLLAYSLVALWFLFLSTQYAFLGFEAKGQSHSITLLQSITSLMDAGFPSLAILVGAMIVAIPLVFLCSVLVVAVALLTQRPTIFAQRALQLSVKLLPWSMAEIFLIGTLVSFIKIVALADVALGLSFWSYCAFGISMVLVVKHLDRHTLWIKLGKPERAAGSTTIRSNSLQHTVIWLVTSVICYIPANTLPIMKTKLLGEETANTLISGVVTLWSHGSYPIATIIFIASVFVPLGKIVILAWLCILAKRKNLHDARRKTQLYRLTEFVGRWSMIDVFVVGVLVALVQLGEIMAIQPGIATLAFTLLVFSTMLAAMSFDPKSIWENEETIRV